MPMETNKSLRLYEVAPNTYDMPGGLYRGSFSIIMSDAALARLSEEDRKAVLSTTGEVLSAMAGKVWADADVEGYENAKKVGVKFTAASEDDQKAFAAVAKQIRDKVVKEVVDNAKVDAEAAVAFIDEQMKNYKK
jgi:TRAP-type C4-dicarboxylate transport system substrate-binding protein